MESMEDMEELEKLREKKLAERDERIQNIISLIRKLCCVLLAIAVVPAAGIPMMQTTLAASISRPAQRIRN